MTPRYFIVFRNPEHLKEVDFGNWINVERAVQFHEDVTLIDGEDESDRHFWCILSSQREKARLCETGARTPSDIRLKRAQLPDKLYEEDKDEKGKN